MAFYFKLIMLYKRILFVAAFIAVSVSTSAQNVAAPAPVEPLPLPKQLAWQKMEMVAFTHYGLNTFNDREWGYGDIDPKTFNPSRQDCDQWVRTIKAAGCKEIVITAKHHDGFCLWPTKMNTDYNISCTPYKDGKGDVVGELEKACRKYGMRFGVYLSPWDRHSAVYGTPAYLDYYHAQLKELLTNYGEISEMWFDGANGGDGYYGGTRETRKIDRKNYYNFPYINRYVQELQPSVIIFGDGGPGCRWIGNESGIAGATNWSFLRSGEVFPGYDKYQTLTSGHPDGDRWIPGEADVSIRPGWFYHDSQNNEVKSVNKLVELYYQSVGHNAVLMLNFPPNKEGLISKTDSVNAILAHQQIMRELGNDLFKGLYPAASAERGDAFRANTVTDGNYDSYWSVADDVKECSLTFRLQRAEKINRITLQEYVPLGQRVGNFDIKYKTAQGGMDTINAHEVTTTIGYKRIVRFETVKTDEITITFNSQRGPVCINNVQAFYSGDDDAFASQHENSEGNSNTLDFGVNIKGNDILIDLGKPVEVSRLYYTPQPDGGMIYNYSVYTATAVAKGKATKGMKKIASGEFSNIQNSPVEQTVKFKKAKTRYLVLKADKLAGGSGTVKAKKIRVY
jgi:alpha-L-fucosidase